MFKAYARPVIASMPVEEVTPGRPEDLMPIWTSKTETANRVQGRIENVLDYAAAHRYRDPVNPARWRGHFDNLLAKPARVRIREVPLDQRHRAHAYVEARLLNISTFISCFDLNSSTPPP